VVTYEMKLFQRSISHVTTVGGYMSKNSNLFQNNFISHVAKLRHKQATKITFINVVVIRLSYYGDIFVKICELKYHCCCDYSYTTLHI